MGKKFFGAIYKDKRRTDHRDHYQDIVDGRVRGFGYSVEKARKNLRLCEMFPPDQPLVRLIKHIVIVREYETDEWKLAGEPYRSFDKERDRWGTKQKVVPAGPTREIWRMDLGSMLGEEMKLQEVVEEEWAEVPLGDGRYMKGTIFRKEPVGPPDFESVKEFLDFDSSGGSYEFTPKIEQLWSGARREFHILEYILFNDFKVSEQMHKIFGVYHKHNDGDVRFTTVQYNSQRKREFI